MASAAARPHRCPSGPGWTGRELPGKGRGWCGAAAAGLALLLAGCSGTRFGDQLARSFSSPGTPAPSPQAPAGSPGPGAAALSPGTSASGATAGARPAAGAGQAPGGAAQPAGAATAARAAASGQPTAAAGPSTPARAQPLSPAPYRVTIKLPGADPSAPAEAVTRALRAAGVSFEVETIERIAPAGSAAAPAAAAQPAPVLTPAPAPR